MYGLWDDRRLRLHVILVLGGKSVEVGGPVDL